MSLTWKVYQSGEYVAACKYATDAAALAGMTSEGVVKHDGRIVWRDGQEDINLGNGHHTDTAADSWDGAAEIMLQRTRQHRLDRINKRDG
jgi:hypothetical protein